MTMPGTCVCALNRPTHNNVVLVCVCVCSALPHVVLSIVVHVVVVHHQTTQPLTKHHPRVFNHLHLPTKTAPLVHVEELVPEGPLSLSPPTTLLRTPLITKGTNTVGVVAWVLTLCTPECPGGRQVVAIANDITHHSGAFGTAEDAMFLAATHYALRERLPVVYLAANSGARVGLAQEVKQCLQVTAL